MSVEQFRRRLRHAVVTGDVVTARRLIKGGVDIKETLWYDGTLLHEAVAAGNAAMITLLLRTDPDVRAINAQNKDGRTALHLAARYGSQAIVNELISAKAEVNCKTSDGRTPLHVAIWRKHRDVVQILIEAGADVNQPDADGWTALHWAARYSDVITAETLLQHDVGVNAIDKNGRTALHLCLIDPCPDLLKMLLHHGADFNIQPKNGSLLSLITLRHQWSPPDISRCLQHLMNAGYRASTDPSHRKVKSALEQRLKNEPEVLQQLDAQTDGVPPLMHLCRARIRHHLTCCHDGRALLRWIDRLQLPVVVKEYLAFTAEFKT